MLIYEIVKRSSSSVPRYGCTLCAQLPTGKFLDNSDVQVASSLDLLDVDDGEPPLQHGHQHPATGLQSPHHMTPIVWPDFILVKLIGQRSWFPGAPQHILQTEPRRIQAGLFVMIFVISKILIRIFVISTPCSWP